MPSESAVLSTVATAVTNAINAAGITQRGQVGPGWPTATEMTSVLAQIDGEWLVSVYPLKGSRNVTRNRPEYQVLQRPSVTVTASVSGNVLTFAGTPQAGLNIHVFPDAPKPDAVYLTTASDTLASIAVSVAGAISAQTGYIATPSGASVTVAGCRTLRCNIGGSQQVLAAREVGRIQQDVQVTAWAPDDQIRSLLHDAIISGVGQLGSMYFTLPDGSDFSMKFHTSSWSDESQSSYSLYVSHLIYTCEYGINQSVVATQVESVIASTTDNSHPGGVGYSAGP